MKLQQPFKKSLSTIAIFLLGIFAVVGLSYAAAPDGNAFKPINEGPDTQVRCRAYDTTKPIRKEYAYTDCQYTSPLITTGLFIKKPNTTFEIQGDPKYSDSTKYTKDEQEWANGALYVGCSDDDKKYSPSIREGCYNKTPENGQPAAYLNGDIYIYELADPNATTDRKLCISNENNGNNGTPFDPKDDKTIGQVIICPGQ